MTTLRSRPVAPCVTIMICVAGCSSTTTEDMPYSRTLPPPDFDNTPRVEQRIAARPVPPQRPAPKPITVDVPMAVLEDTPPPTLMTQFEAVPDTHFDPTQSAAVVPEVKPFFTPIQTAEAILAPLVEPTAPDAVAVSEPIAYPKYVTVGPEYFGPDSDIAPYVISRSNTTAQPRTQYAEAQIEAWRPQRIVSESGRYSVIAEVITPTPRAAPPRQAPLPAPPEPAIEVAALVPPRPDPQPRRAPTEAPRSPSRKTPDRLAAPVIRDDTLDVADNEARSRWLARVDAPELPERQPQSQFEPAMREPDDPDAPPREPVYRIRVAPPERPMTELASLGSDLPAIDTQPLAPLVAPEYDELTADAQFNAMQDFFAPTPRPKPEQPAIRIAGTYTGVTSEPASPIVKPPANDPTQATSCLVNRGSNERMILICQGVDVSQAQVFRAVVEGESAYRGLRAFNDADEIIRTYGFNNDRFLAMSRGPRTARDLAFLRALRKSGKIVRVKGRVFELYLMKGDLDLATVLIEQVAAVEQPQAIKLH